MTPYYEDDAVTLYHGDCRDVLPSIKADLVVTDPPYASGARRDADRQVRGSMLRSLEHADWFSHDAMTTWGLSWFLRSAFGPMAQALDAGAHVYCFTDWRMAPTVYGMFEASGYRVNHCLVWDKEHYGMGSYWRNQHENIVFASLGQPAEMRDHGCGSVLRCRAVSPLRRVHPTEKPVEILTRIIRAAPGDIVLDPFAGSGATLRAAKDVGRKAIGIEIDERYCAIAVEQLRQGALFA